MSLSAVDNQVYFSMCSPARDLKQNYHAVSSYKCSPNPDADMAQQWGHSLVVDPM